MNRLAIVKRLNIFMRPLYGAMAFSITMRVLNLLSATLLIAIAAGTVGRFVADPVNTVLWRSAGWLVLAAMGLGFFHYLEQYSGHYIAFRLLATLRNHFYQALEPLAPAGMGKMRTGDAIARVINDVERIEPYYAHFVAPVAAAVIVPIVLLSYLASYHASLAWTLLPFLLLLTVAVPLIVDAMSRDASHESRRIFGNINAHLTDSLQGLREVVVFGYGQRRRQEIATTGKGLEVAQDKMIGADAVQRSLQEILIASAVVTMLGVGLSLAERDIIDLLRDLPIIIAVTLTSFTAAVGVTNAMNDFNIAMINAERVYELMDQVPTVQETSTKTPEQIIPSLHFEDVCFHYGSNGNGRSANILQNLNLSVPVGKTIALVGESGAGKSTIINLLMRFWECTEGQIRLGDHDLKSFPLADLRDQIAVVSQRTYIFNTTIGENIHMGNPEATDEQLLKAAEQANLLEFIEGLPEGLDTPVGEMGSLLSGGQRQRIAIARALLKDAPILILDEATSDLDVKTEQEVKSAIDTLMADRTTLVIAHRLSAIVDADEILVLKDGAICENGRHDQLLAANGVYTRLFRLQQDEIDTIVE